MCLAVPISCILGGAPALEAVCLQRPLNHLWYYYCLLALGPSPLYAAIDQTTSSSPHPRRTPQLDSESAKSHACDTSIPQNSPCHTLTSPHLVSHDTTSCSPPGTLPSLPICLASWLTPSNPMMREHHTCDDISTPSFASRATLATLP